MTTVALEDLTAEAAKLLDSLGEGSMSPCAYDTAWVARLRQPHNPDEPLFPASFDWLLRNQHADGSWGAEIPFAHDRVICTMSALVALADAGPYRHDEAQLAVRRGVLYLNRERPNLHDDPAETVGFELILPELVRQAKALDLRLPYKDWEFVEALKVDKLRRIPPIAVYGGPTPLSHSLEYLGDHLAPMLIPRCQSPNGSYGASPSATAYVQMHVPDSDNLRYLREAITASGGAPSLYPVETYEAAWVLQYLETLRPVLPELRPALDSMEERWDPMGVGITREWSVADVDNTAVVAYLLTTCGAYPDTGPLALFEGVDYFYTYIYERNPSVTSNAHIVRALRQYPSSIETRRTIVKLVHFLEKAMVGGRYWVDKWHASPYYATERAVTALAGLAHELVRPAVAWILETQQENGAWGAAEGTMEETALALRALMVVSETDVSLQSLTTPALERGGAYLAERAAAPDYAALWVGKGFYAPYNVIRAIVLSALYRWVDMRS